MTNEPSNVTPPMDRAVRQSMRYCRKVVRKHARNFYYGMKLTPEPKRSALYCIYAFMRACDDLVDEPVDTQQPLTAAEGASRIAGFRATMQRVLDTGELPEGTRPRRSIWPAFRYTVRAYPIEHKLLHEMLDGQRRDLADQRFQTFDDLYAYCYKVAGVVGLVCISVWGTDGNAAVRKLAEYRGIAFQLTNILRDLREDAMRKRVYLPQDELARFGISADKLVDSEGKNFDRLMTFQIERARSYYEMSDHLDSHISAECQATSWAMTQIYRGILEKIAEDPRQVLRGRVRLSRLRKMRIALNARFRRPRRARRED